MKNLGVTFDADLSFKTHISSVCRSSFYHIRQIRTARPSLDSKSAILLANALVSSKLDYCNSLYSSLPDCSIHRLQRVQNSLARAIVPTIKRSQHITPTLRALHWLPIRQRITYKIAMLTFKTLQYKQPSYLADLLHPHTSSRSLRSTDQRLLTIPLVKSAIGRCYFSYCAPTLWNSLPPSLRFSDSLLSFRCQLKTYLFPP